MAPRVVAALAMLMLLCGPDLVASRSLLEDCGKCNVPVDKGGCKCDANCACLPGGQPAPAPGGGGGKCDKCNLPENASGCKCDANCDCVATSTPAPPAPPAPPASPPFKAVACTSGGGGCSDVQILCSVGANPVGTVCMGRCYRFFFNFEARCKIEHCDKGSPKDRCNEYLKEQCNGKCEGRVL